MQWQEGYDFRVERPEDPMRSLRIYEDQTTQITTRHQAHVKTAIPSTRDAAV